MARPTARGADAAQMQNPAARDSTITATPMRRSGAGVTPSGRRSTLSTTGARPVVQRASRRPSPARRQREQQAFHQHRAQDSPAARPQRKPDRDLAGPGLSPRQKQIRHIAGSDREHQPYHGHQQKERCPQIVAQRRLLARCIAARRETAGETRSGACRNRGALELHQSRGPMLPPRAAGTPDPRSAPPVSDPSLGPDVPSLHTCEGQANRTGDSPSPGAASLKARCPGAEVQRNPELGRQQYR